MTETRWELVLTPLAVQLWREIQRAGDNEAFDIGELCAIVGRRKTPVRTAIAELEYHGLVHIEEVT